MPTTLPFSRAAPIPHTTTIVAAPTLRAHRRIASLPHPHPHPTLPLRHQITHAQMAAAASSSPPPCKPLVVVGSVNADFVLSVDRLPQAGETLSASKLELFPGGKGANQAAAAARLGHPTHFIGQNGRGSNGEFLRAALADSGVILDALKTVDEEPGSAYIFLQPSGENSIVILGGANQHPWALSESDEALISRAGAVLLQREIPEAVNAKVAAVARKGGVPVILDAGGEDGPLPPSLLANLTVLSPNETELARLTGLPTATEEETVAAARALLQSATQEGGALSHVLVKLGARGAMMIGGGAEEGGGVLRQAAGAVPTVVDTTGAGDCFTAAFAVGFVKGWPAKRCVAFATAAAGLCIQAKGAMSSLPRLADLPQDVRGD